MVEPSSTPAGTWIVNVVVSLRRPSPRQSTHGVSMREPMPLQRVHGIEVTIWPRIELRTRCMTPVAGALDTGRRRRPGRAARTVARGAAVRERHRDLFGRAEGRVVERDVE